MKNERNDDHRLALQQAFDAPWPGPVGEPAILENDFLQLCVYPQDGARIVSLKAFGHEVLRQWNPQRRAFQYGCFPMAPWVGRLGNGKLQVGEQSYSLPVNKTPHALHGMACYSDWEVVSQTVDSLTLQSSLNSPWPWPGKVIQTLALQESALQLRLEIVSTHDTFPASAGWHPWFRKQLDEQGELNVKFLADWQEEAGNNELPTGKRIPPQAGPWDDCFGFNEGIKATLCWPGKLSMEMTSPAHSLVVFDKQPDATCINPLTQAPNAINLRPQHVKRDVPLVIETCWRFHELC